MYCKKCGKLLNPNAKFCVGCGTPVPAGAAGKAAQTNSVKPQRTEMPQNTGVKKQKKSKGPLIAVLALIVVLILAVAVLLVLNYNKKQEAARAQEQARQEEEDRRERREREKEKEKEKEEGEEEAAEEEPAAEAPAEEEPAEEEPEAAEQPSLPSIGLNEEFVFFDSDCRYLERWEVEGLSQRELSVARNEIYARYGRMFNNEELQEYFDGTSWYVPLYSPEDFDNMGGDSVLNAYELANKNLIVEIEKEKGYR